MELNRHHLRQTHLGKVTRQQRIIENAENEMVAASTVTVA